jgi:hypothetical protein
LTTKISRALAELDFNNSLATRRTGLTCPAINQELLSEVTRPAILIAEIPQRGTSGGYGLQQYLANGFG